MRLCIQCDCKGCCVIYLYLINKVQTMQIKYYVCRKTHFSSPTLHTRGSVTQNCFMHVFLWAPLDSSSQYSESSELDYLAACWCFYIVKWIPNKIDSLWFWAIVHTFIRFSTKYLIRPNISRTAWPSILTWRFGKM